MKSVFDWGSTYRHVRITDRLYLKPITNCIAEAGDETNRIINFIDSVELRKLIKDGVHRVEHRDDFHRRDSAADLREGHDVAEQDRHALKHLDISPKVIQYIILVNHN